MHSYLAIGIILDYIAEADCKLTLYKNCRNTENIAKTSLKPISERKPKLIQGCMTGEPAIVHFCKEDKIIKSLDNALAGLRNDGFKNIVILTTKTLEKSAVQAMIKQIKGEDLYRGVVPIATCRTFKGLEADAIILIDVERETFEGDDAMLFYVGTSRARFRLEIVTAMSDEDCSYVLKNDLAFEGKVKNPYKTFASALNALGSMDD